MTGILAHDNETLREALATPSDDVEVTLNLPCSTAARILMLLEAELHGGAWVLPMEQDLTTTQAARALGVSRPHLVELLKSGALEHHKVGTHRRVPVAALQAYKTERDRRTQRHALTNHPQPGPMANSDEPLRPGYPPCEGSRLTPYDHATNTQQH